MSRRSYSSEFKRESASLVIDQGYSIQEGTQATGVGETALRRWVNQLREERAGQTATTSKAITPEQQKIQALEAKIKRIEREKEILKKATALLMSDTMRSC